MTSTFERSSQMDAVGALATTSTQLSSHTRSHAASKSRSKSGSTKGPANGPANGPAKERSILAKSLFNTIPIVLASTMALSLNLTSPIHAEIKRTDKPKPSPSELGKSIREAFAAASRAATASVSDRAAHSQASSGTMSVATVAPSVYTVVAGDSISSIAGRFGLATASVLAMNGLGWKSVIFPGQKLTLGKAGVTPIASTQAAVTPTTRYTILTGDTVSRIASKFGLTVNTILSANGLSASSVIYPGQTLALPAGIQTMSVSQQTINASPAAAARTISGTSYVIKSGDSIAGVAARFGVTTQAILTANGLGWSSIIYSGKSLTIPAPQVVEAAFVTSAIPSSVLTAEMRANALTIIRVGHSLGVPSYGIVIALAAAAQESGLRNLTYGDRDSLGLFQQRPSAGWGTPSQILDATYSAKLFYGGPRNPNAVNTRGLLDIVGWQQLKLTQAAQAVQLSAFPTAYAKWETAARGWLKQLT